MAEIANPRRHNRLLSALSNDDWNRLAPSLEPCPMPLRFAAIIANHTIEHVYFPEDSIVSVVAVGGPNDRAEIGLVGLEGVTGVAVILGADRSPHEAYVQVAGSALRMPAEALRDAMVRSPALRSLMLAYANAFALQTAGTALANSRQLLEGRLARWLLMLLDRVHGNELAITHEFLSVMLGVRRSGVTETIHVLEGRQFIRAERGKILVLDRPGLEHSADGFYGGPEREYDRLLGELAPKQNGRADHHAAGPFTD